VILTGYSHGVDPVGIGAFEAAATYPARGESRFAGRPDGYLTTLPGTRAALFYWPGTMEPAVVRTDEATKETTGEIVEASGITVVEAMAGTPAITVPVLVAVGELDTIVCGLPACLQAEPAYYGRPDLVSTISMPDTGHDLNLSYSAPDFFAQVNRWLAS
jgi:pimeloyl-ACP methyl ester carboxylesterase